MSVLPPNSPACVRSVHLDYRHSFSKKAQLHIRLLAGLGIEGDAHCGATVQHRYDKKKAPGAPNLRQVHLIQSELLDELLGQGFEVAAGDLGENISTRGIDLIHLPAGTQLSLGNEAVVELTGLRHPCVYIDRFQKGLRAQMNAGKPGDLPSKAGVMSIVIQGGVVNPGDSIAIHLPRGKHVPLGFV